MYKRGYKEQERTNLPGYVRLQNMQERVQRLIGDLNQHRHSIKHMKIVDKTVDKSVEEQVQGYYKAKLMQDEINDIKARMYKLDTALIEAGAKRIDRR